MTGQTVGTAVATTQQQQTPAALVKAHMGDFASVLPSHIKPETWVRLAQGALKKGKKFQVNGQDTDRTELEQAALNNPAAFMASLLDAARLGLEPGTEQYYLTPRKVKNKLEILGIPGYQGYIELMYRAGAVSSVVAEVVYSDDVFKFQPGRDEVPDHEIDWDATERGALRLVYAFARMRDGGTSRVVVLNKADITRIKKSSPASSTDYSPWTTNEAAMWLKSAVRQLAKWVPTSAEYMREQLRAIADVQAEQDQRRNHHAPIINDIDPEPDWVPGEVVEEAPAPAQNLATGEQLKKLHTQLSKLGVPQTERADTLALVLGHALPDGSTKNLTRDEAVTVIELLERPLGDLEPAKAFDALLGQLADQTGESS